MNPTSTSAAGIVAPTSTLNGACFTPRFATPVAAFISSWIACAKRLVSSRYVWCARSHRISFKSDADGSATGEAAADAVSVSAAFYASSSDASTERKYDTDPFLYLTPDQL